MSAQANAGAARRPWRGTSRGDGVDDHLDAVRRAARGYAGLGVPQEDLVQEGIVAVVLAARRSDPTGGRPLPLRAAKRSACRAMRRAVEKHGTIVSFPLGVREDVFRLLDARDALAAELGREPEAAEIALSLGDAWRADRVAHAMNAGVSMGLLDAEVCAGDRPDDGSRGGPEQTADEDAPEEVAVQRAMAARLREEIEILPWIERRVLSARYGLDGGVPKPVSDLARSLDLDEHRVRRIQRSAQTRLAGRISRPWRRPQA